MLLVIIAITVLSSQQNHFLCVIQFCLQVLTVDGVRMMNLDVPASNGIIHVIDGVLIPPANTLLEIIQKEEDLSTLSQIIKIAGLEELLNTGNFVRSTTSLKVYIVF